MKSSNSQFWIPFNVGLEYQRNRINQIKSGEQVRKGIDNGFSSIKKTMDNLISHIESKKSKKYNEIVSELKELSSEVNKKAEDFLNKHHDFFTIPDKIRLFR